MIIQCERCKTRFNINDALLNRPRLRLRCSHCAHVFTLERPVPDDAPLVLQPHQVISRGQSIVFCNQKGGVAKTTSCFNIGMALSKIGHRVLFIDFDPQANLSALAGHSNSATSFYDAVVKTTKIAEYIRLLPYGPSLLPSNSGMNLLPKHYLHVKNHERLLRNAIEGVREQFDYILIDTPPSLKFFTLNALMAADFAVIPTQCAYLSMNGVEQIGRVIDAVRKRNQSPLEQRLLITLYDPNSAAAKAVHKMLTQRYAGAIFAQPIPMDDAVQEAQILNKPLADYAPQGIAAQAYLAAAQELQKGRGSSRI
jgi:chromosome partitioning protein